MNVELNSKSLDYNLNLIPGSVGAALYEGELRLGYADIIRPRRHAELLLETVLGMDRTELYLHSGEQIDVFQLERFRSLLLRREAGEPVQYIVGWAPFFGRKFAVGQGVFIPRFETETLIECLISRFPHDLQNEHPVEILDVCCGCGVIGLTIAAEIPHVKVTLTDGSETALMFCRRNAKNMGIGDRIEITEWDALEYPPAEWQGKFRFILANPPYIPVDEIGGLPKDVRDGEPHEALTDRGDGLAFYRCWTESLPEILVPGGRIFLEIDQNAAEKVSEIMSHSFTDLAIHKDLDGNDRVLTGTLISSC
ncbi:peptide chain release factor N(5)-glutamine methyltransferase [bacterium]|nr:peptide chain release factor N(5)-glutamine methyltransferase [bacterium]